MVTARRQSQPRPQTVARRREILEAASEIFGSKGYTNGTLSDIAEQVNMTHPGILHHFGSKDQLLMEVLSFRDETDVQNLADQHIPDGIEFFRHLVTTAFANARRAGIVQAFVVLSAESVTDDHPAREFFIGRYRTLRGEARHAFEVMCAERTTVPPETVALASAAILAVMDGLQVQWLLEPDEVQLGKASEFAIEAILAAVLDPREPILTREEP